MLNNNKCRVCLVDAAKHPIFEDIESKDSIHSKLFQCFKEKIEDIEGYPQKICESCKDILDTIDNFITKYKTSCKLLESGLIELETEGGDNDSHTKCMKDEYEFEICKEYKNEPKSDSDGLEPDDFWITELPQAKKQETSLAELKAKLKNLKEINFKKKPVRKNHCKASKVASSILEAEFDWNGESFKSSKLNVTIEEKTNVTKRKVTKIVLPKRPKPPAQKLCDICGVIFNRDKLSRHKQTQHFNIQIKCPQCPRTLVSQYHLKRHLKRAHDKNKQFVCDPCGRGFTFKGELTSHIKVVHLKIPKPKKKHSCEKCNRSFVTAKSLIIHERSIHTGLRPAECEICGSCFFHDDYLKEHMRLHTGETPFKCPICGRGYAQRGNMRSHISHNHRLADLSPEMISTLRPSWFKFLKKPL